MTGRDYIRFKVYRVADEAIFRLMGGEWGRSDYRAEAGQ